MFDTEKLYLFWKLDSFSCCQNTLKQQRSVTSVEHLWIHLYFPSLTVKLITNTASYVFAANILACLANAL